MNDDQKRKQEDGRPQIYTDDQLKEALTNAFGFVGVAARALHIDRRTIQRRIAASQDLKEFVEELLEGNLDMSEVALMSRVRAGDTSAIKYHLNCKGRHRGFGERVMVEQLDGLTDDELLAKAAALMAERADLMD